MARSAWVLLAVALVAAGTLAWWRMAMPPAASGPVATAAVAPPATAGSAASETASAAPAGTTKAAPFETAAVAPSAGPSAAPAAGTGESKAEKPSFDVVRVAPSGSAVIAGRAAPGAEVTIMDGADEVGRAVADHRGEWVILPSRNLAPGTHALVVETPDGARSDDVAVLVPEKPKEAGAATKTEQPLAVLLPKDAPARPLQGSPAAPAGVHALDAVA
jgi:hypothetical protein